MTEPEQVVVGRVDDQGEPVRLLGSGAAGSWSGIADAVQVDEPALHNGNLAAKLAAKASAAAALVAIRRRTGRPIPADVLRLAELD